MAIPQAEISVIIVSFNTREMTLKAIETLYENASDIALQVIVWDNASHDGSPDAIEVFFPQVELHRSPDNIGFAAANNRAAEFATAEWILLLNSDTETLPGSIQNLLAFAEANAEAGIVGGRTIFADGSLNATSCFNRVTLWSLLCSATMLSRLFPHSPVFNPERSVSRRMDRVQKVDIITGCFFLLRTALWRKLGGFDLRYFMYSEESDLCLRAAKLGYRPMVTPDATIIHHGGASAVSSGQKQVQSYRGKVTIIRDHFSVLARPLGIALLWITALNRHLGHRLVSRIRRREAPQAPMWKAVWEQRRDWLGGY
ncbi:MAG: glycosyltransferase family 2 protein [Erythrobacter sp.]|uniref:glycosyltransferase family 2 protein n=1 Tax=Erythrobacter sp. TaxID=1042 RepID=UPI0032ECA8C0